MNSKQISVLRIAATIAVVALHLAGNMSPVLRPSEFWSNFNTVVRILSFWAVPVFVIVSGYCLLGRDLSVREFYRRRTARVLWPLVVWSVFYYLFRAVSKTGLSGRDLWVSLWVGAPYYHLWFLYMLLGLYALAPWYEKFRRNRSLAGESVTVGILMVAGWGIANIVPRVWVTQVSSLFMTGFPVRALDIFGLFALGPLLGRLAQVRSIRWWALALIVADGLLKLTLWKLGYHDWLDWLCFYFNFEAALIGSAVFLFLMSFRDWRQPAGAVRKWTEAAAQATFGVYLCHALLIYIASRVPGLFRPDALHYAGAMLLVIGGSFGICIIIKRIPYLRKII